jgi:hypothetical protein
MNRALISQKLTGWNLISRDVTGRTLLTGWDLMSRDLIGRDITDRALMNKFLLVKHTHKGPYHGSGPYQSEATLSVETLSVGLNVKLHYY